MNPVIRVAVTSVLLAVAACGRTRPGLGAGDGAAGTSVDGAAGTTGGAGTSGGAGTTGGAGADASAGSDGGTSADGGDGSDAQAGSGAGGFPVLPPTVETSPIATDCTVQLGSSAGGKVMVDATLDCDVPLIGLHVAPGAGDRFFVLASRDAEPMPPMPSLPRLLSIDGFGGPAIARAPSGVLIGAKLLVDKNGAPYLAGRTNDIDRQSLWFYRPMNAGWLREAIPLIAGERPQDVDVIDGGILADGRAMIAISWTGQNPRLATRGATGEWTSQLVPNASAWPAALRLRVDAGGMRVSYLQDDPEQFVVSQWRPDSGDTKRLYPRNAVGEVDAAETIVSVKDGNQIDFIHNQGVLETNHWGLDGAARVVTGCPPASASDTFHPPVTCSETGLALPGQHALASTTPDHAVWVAYADAHIDRDATVECTLYLGFYQCPKKIIADRSRTDLVIGSMLSGQFPFQVTERFRAPIDARLAEPQVAMAAQGTRLAVAFSTSADGNGYRTKTVRFLVLDTTKL